MLGKIGEFLRTFVIPLGATAIAVLFWSQYKCQNAWWWLVAVGLILVIHFAFYFRSRRRRSES